MEFTLQELYEFANVSSPGGNHYALFETERVWNTEKGRHLSSLCDLKSFYQHFIMVHIYGAMAQRYSGVFDTRESYCYNEVKPLYDLLSKSIFPFGYKFYTLECKNGYKLIIQKDKEPLQNIEARIGVEYYNDIPDKVHRPPYYIVPNIVEEYLSCNVSEYEMKMKNNLLWTVAIDKLKIFQFEIDRKNVINFLNSIDEEKLSRIYYDMYDNVEYEDSTCDMEYNLSLIHI
jgi:hypothetical protein